MNWIADIINWRIKKQLFCKVAQVSEKYLLTTKTDQLKTVLWTRDIMELKKEKNGKRRITACLLVEPHAPALSNHRALYR